MHSGESEGKLRDYLKRVTEELTKTRRRLREIESARHEPIAIVGMACRLPGGVESPKDLWRVVAEEIDTVAPFPADRGWNLDDPDRTYSPEAALLDDVDGFDHSFFDMSPGEALVMDPQHRLLLETCWEAVERARIDARTLAKRRVGVYIGISDSLQCMTAAAGSADRNRLHDTTIGVASGRIAYHLGLRGPAVSIDSACSSALVGIHMATGSLRNRECQLALVGGALVLPSTLAFDGYGRSGELAADARVKPFAADADGTNLAEGVGVILLERLSDAKRNGHRVLAVVRGSAIGQDGVRSSFDSLTDLGQEQVIRAALADAGLSAADIDAVEAHGNGNLAGDQLEAEVLVATYGRKHSNDRPLWIGSAKSNWGNAPHATGITGVIKMVMAMRHGVLPKTLHVDTLSPYVDWSSGGVRVLQEARPWPQTEAPRRAAVSGHSAVGSIAHVIVEQATEDDAPAVTAASPVPVPWPLSARSQAALRAQAERLSAQLTDRTENPVDVAYSLATTRASFEHRAVVVESDADGLLAGLRAIARGREAVQVVRGNGRAGGTAMVFTGQGSPSAETVRRLCTAFPRFAEAYEEIRDQLDRDATTARRDPIDDAGPGTRFAVDVALYRLFASWGITVDYLSGYSIGEVSVAHVCDVLSLPDACKLVVARSRWCRGFSGDGEVAGARGSSQTDSASVKLREVVAGLSFNPPKISVLSSPAGVAATRENLRDPEYWVGQAHGETPLADGVKALSAAGVTTFFELGAAQAPFAVTKDHVDDPTAEVIAVLDPRLPDTTSITKAVARAHARAVPVDWRSYFDGTASRAIDLPTYPFQH